MHDSRYYHLGKEVSFDILKGELICNDSRIKLGGRETVLLKLLYENSNQVVLKSDIVATVWGPVLVSETSLTKAISNLRKSLAKHQDATKCEIKTVPKEGYVLILEEQMNTSESAPPAFQVANIKFADNDDAFNIFGKFREKKERTINISISVIVVMILFFSGIFMFMHWS